MKEYNNIGEFVKNKLDGYREEPPNHVWNNIESKISSSPSGVSTNWWIAAAGVVVVAAAVYFFAFNEQDKSTQSTQEKTSSEMVEEKPAETIKKEAEDRADRGQTFTDQETTKQDNKKPDEKEQVQEKPNAKAEVPEQKEMSKTDDIEDIQQIKRKQARLSSESLGIQKSPSRLETTSQAALYEHVRKTSDVKDKELFEDTSKTITFSEDKAVCAGEEITLWASGGINYQWSDGSTDSIISIQPQQPRKYTVTVWKSEQDTVIHDFNVDIKECGALYVPNAFSPNSDGYNDKFKAYGVAIEDFQIKIMNKNGVIVYQSQDIDEGWDGSYNNRPAPPGVYVYRIVYTGVEGETKTKTGTVTLIR
ncbi:MAG: gliding motility-associated C-terminal domain-containing protein [Bacteroidales bacterium]